MKRFSKIKLGAIGILLIAFFVLVNLPGFSKGIRNFFYSFSSPIQRMLLGAGDNMSNFFAGIFSYGNLKKENDNFKVQILEKSAEISGLQELKKENEALKAGLVQNLQKDFKLIFANIVSKGIGDFILINKGLNDGVKKDMPVITEQKFLLGKIYEVYKNYSKVLLITNKDSSFDAEILSAEATGVLKGKGNFNAVLDSVPQEAEIKTGDLVFTTSLGDVFPEGLLVGEIKSLNKNDVSSFQQAEIKPAFDKALKSSVFIISNF